MIQREEGDGSLSPHPQIHRFMRYFYRGSFSAAKSGRERAPASFLHLHKNNAFFLIIREQ